VEEAQYVREGTLLLEADGIELAEIEAQIPISEHARPDAPGADPTWASFPAKGLAGSSASRRRYGCATPAATCAGMRRVARISDTLDLKTRTVGIIVEVDRPYGDVRPGERPPLVKGLFVEVELRGRPAAGRLVIPRLALHAERVYGGSKTGASRSVR
jgi:membrane fusion protein, multidrug efflux system